MAWGRRKDNNQPYVKTGKKGVSGAGSKTDSVADVHLKESKTSIQGKTHLPKELDIHEEHWGFEIENGKIKEVRLGNHTNEGWVWYGNDSDLNLFLIRVAKSKIKDEVAEKLEESGVDFEALRKMLLEGLEGDINKDSNGLYALTGDNRRWEFHDDIDEGAEANEILRSLEADGKITEKQSEELDNDLWDNFNGVSYEDFLKEHGEGIRDELKQIVKESDNFKEFFKAVTSWDKIQYQITEDYVLMYGDAINDAIMKTAKEKGFSVN